MKETKGRPTGPRRPRRRKPIDDENFLPYGRQLIEEDDIAAVVAVLRDKWLTTGPAVKSFEDALAARVGASHAVACASGTAALHLAMLALDIAPGDRVVVPTLTFLASANAVRLAGGEVVFADVDPDTGLMTPETLQAALLRASGDGGGRVRAIMPVHLNGQAAAMEPIAEIARQRGIPLVVDAAHALGAAFHQDGTWHPVGTDRHAAMTAFSFHPVKTIAMGEGGAVTTGDEKLARRLRQFRNHGMVRDPEAFTQPDLAFDSEGGANPWYYEMPAVGLNYRVTDIQCALGLSQLGKLERFVARRVHLAALYDRALAPLAPAIRPIPRVAHSQAAWHLYVVLIDFDALGVDRATLMRALHSSAVGTMVHYIPVHLQPYYRARYGPVDLPGAMAYYRRALSLPLFPAMADDDIERVVRRIKRVIERD